MTRAPVVLTRPEGQNTLLAHALRGRGHPVLELPALTLTSIAGPLPDPAEFDLVMFVSGNAVRMFLDQCLAAGRTGWPAGTTAAVVGPSSARALRDHAAFGHGPVIVQPAEDTPTFDSEALWRRIQDLSVLPARVLIVRGGSGEQGAGRDWLAARLRAAGVTVDIFRAYSRLPSVWLAAQTAFLQDLVGRQRPAIWLCTSGEGVDAIHAELLQRGWLDWWKTCTLIATHPRIGAHLAELVEMPPHGNCQAMLLISSPRDGDILAAIESTP